MTVGASRRAGRLRTAAAVLAVVAMACSSTAGEPSAGETAAAGVARGEATSLPSTSTSASASASEPRDPSSTSPSELSRDGTAPATATASDEHALERSLPTSDVPTEACPVPVAPGTPGVTDDEIAVGAPRLANVTDVATGLEPPESELDEYVDAMVDHVNATGGIACRRVRVVWHDLDMSSTATWGPASEQAMCATWTQDDEVFAAFPGGFAVPYDVLYACLDRAGVAIIDVRGVSFRDRAGFDEVPRLIAVNTVRLDRGTAAQVHALVRQGFLTTDSRIGVAHYDGPRETRTVDDSLIPTLAAQGLSLTERHAVATPVSIADPARERDVANAVLRFKLADVDRVLFVRGSGLAATFMEAAERNDYRPRYGLTTVELTVVALEVPARQLIGSRGIGWYPDWDLQPRRPDSWPARTACLDFFHERGFRTATTVDRIFALSVCEAVWFTRAAIEAAPRPLSTDGVIVGARDLGTSYASPTVQRTRFGRDHRDGAATYRDVAYEEGCGCFAYVGGPRAVP